LFNNKRDNWLKARHVTAYLNQIKYEQGMPLYYIICDPEQEDKYCEDNGEVGNMYEAPFKGQNYENYSFQVMQIL
jgi:hypothetical protein